MAKKIITLVIVLATLLQLTGCIKKTPKPTEPVDPVIDAPHLIYKNNDFEMQVEGEMPTVFDWYFDDGDATSIVKQEAITQARVEVVTAAKGDNANNLAARITGHLDSTGKNPAFIRSMFAYYPIQSTAVIGFSFMVEDFDTPKRTYINTNVTNTTDIASGTNKKYVEFITVKDNDVYWNGTELITSDISEDTWYEVAVLCNIKEHTATIYFDDTEKTVSLDRSINNITELRFDLPAIEDSAWCIDEIRIYESDKRISNAELDADWKEYTKSGYYYGYEFEASKASAYDYMAFVATYQKVFGAVNSNRIFANNQQGKLPTKIYREGDAIMVPAVAIAELFGAKTAFNESTKVLGISYGDHVMEVTLNKDTYTIDKKAGEMTYPVALVNNTACMQLDVLMSFLGRTYTEQDDLLWFGTPAEINWHMPTPAGEVTELNTVVSRSLSRVLTERMQQVLLFDRPSAEDIIEDMAATNPDNYHPRIEVSDFDVLKEQLKKDPEAMKVLSNVISAANGYTNNPLVDHESSDPKRADYTEPLKNEFYAMGFAYNMSDSANVDKYKEGIMRQIKALTTFPDLHFHLNSALGTGTLSYGLAYAYDWLYDAWTEDERILIEELCRTYILDHAARAYRSSLRGYSGTIGFSTGNQSLITNGGIAMLATALYDSDPEYYGFIIRGAIRAAEGGLMSYYPYGEYLEGISYWRYAGDFLPRFVKGLQTAFGTDYGITDIPGILETATFPLRMQGNTNAYAFGDGNPETINIPLMMFSADQLGDKTLAAFRKNGMGSGTVGDLLNWVYDTDGCYVGFDLDPNDTNDTYNRDNATIIMRTGWEKNDTSIAFHGGANNDLHGHLDAGSFQFDMSGVWFGIDLPREDYTLRDSGHYPGKPAMDGDFGYTAGHYYRIKSEGHNTVVVNRQFTNKQLPRHIGSYDVKPSGKAEFIKVNFGSDVSYAVADLKDMNDILESAYRGVKLDKANNTIIIQDELIAKEETDFLWSMHTYAAIEISDDKQSAILTQNGKKIKVTLVSDSDLSFEVLAAKYDEDYGDRTKPPVETPNEVYTTNSEFYEKYGHACDIRMDARKLAIKTEAESLSVAIIIQPYENTNSVPDYVDLEKW